MSSLSLQLVVGDILGLGGKDETEMVLHNPRCPFQLQKRSDVTIVQGYHFLFGGG